MSFGLNTCCVWRSGLIFTGESFPASNEVMEGMQFRT